MFVERNARTFLEVFGRLSIQATRLPNGLWYLINDISSESISSNGHFVFSSKSVLIHLKMSKNRLNCVRLNFVYTYNGKEDK